ncbi:hypothetical protein FOPG_09331 [Fusarium oxysporum f. sp. conglutinans race 2 54008]|uniref:Uncharacterized protein n=1 Tax=Fusarium oxysporum f. sp. conglutinans race 2 54008 TaxID=1089457 RepID=X0HHT1_FUSOX|nr:hypothetical protein FOPG_09331 [Fusarium oxysporum f. sp. conglutinans race 2 54008]
MLFRDPTRAQFFGKLSTNHGISLKGLIKGIEWPWLSP